MLIKESKYIMQGFRIDYGKLINGMWGRMRFETMRRIHTSRQLNKVIPSNLKGKTRSSQEWLTRHINDPYVQKAQELNYRARSAFKLIEIDDKTKILKPGQTVVECGASPGAWSQVIVGRINSDGKNAKKRVGSVIGIDLLPIAPLKGAVFLDGCDFTDPVTLARIKEILAKQDENTATATAIENESAGGGDTKLEGESSPSASLECSPAVQLKKTERVIDVVLSDMAPNATGQRDTDHHRIVKLVECALIFAVENGKPGGHFLAKLWAGSEIQKMESFVAKFYEKVSRHKPPSSRNDSSEIFLLGKYKK